MKSPRFLIPVFLVALLLGAAGADADAAPPYKTLYEEGLYDEAISLIQDSLTSDTLNIKQLLFFLASCYIARGDRDNGAMTFKRLIKIDPGFQLDTILTPPKILEIFKTVRAQEPALQVKTLRPDPRPSPLLSIPLGFVPGGAGQFYHREPKKGALLLAAQAASIAVFVWAGWKRDGCYKSGPQGYGWYEGNEAAYNRYTNYARIGFGIFVGSYTVGVIDYFIKKH
jgi:tetratricopeptide (TPR) repeat protein